jgi:polyvinyl alcohol dehydrogenase (cytochrome)
VIPVARIGLACATGAVLAVGLPATGQQAKATHCSSNWPMFQHGLSRSGAACGTAINRLNVASLAPRWFVRTGGEVTAEPAVVGSTVYVGDGSGLFHALDRATGSTRWTFDAEHNPVHVDRHDYSYGVFVSSAAVVPVAGVGRTVFVGGGGTLYALNASTGRVRWARDLDPHHPTSPAEIESSPIVWRPRGGAPTVYVGLDTNEASASADGGVVAFNARTGALLWKYDAEAERVVHTLTFHDTEGSGGGDVWSSPSIDPATGRLYFAIGNRRLPHGDTEQLFALRAATGKRVWKFNEPPANHTYDNDFGGTPVLVTDPTGRRLVVQAGKSGWVYALSASTGRIVRSVKVASSSAIGGFIGSTAVARVNGRSELFGNTAIPSPGPGANPSQSTSLHAVDLDTGKVLWDEPLQLPAYSPVTYAGGVVFAPDTVGFSVNAYDAATGVPLWRMPVGGAASGGVAISGRSIFFGTGTYFSPGVPPQVTGIWSFALPG